MSHLFHTHIGQNEFSILFPKFTCKNNCSFQTIKMRLLRDFQTLCKCASKFKFTPLSCLESLTNANCTFVKKKICLQERRSIFADAHTMFFASKVFFCKETLLSVGQVVFGTKFLVTSTRWYLYGVFQQVLIIFLEFFQYDFGKNQPS